MAEFPALPLWTDALIGDTTHLTTLEFGVYIKLLIAAWRSPRCELPSDEKLLARYAGISTKLWKGMRTIILAFFTPHSTTRGTALRQKRLRKERKFVLLRSKKQSRRRLGKSLKTNNTTATAVIPRNNLPTPTPTPKEEEEDSDVLRTSSSSVDDTEEFSAATAVKIYNEMARKTGLPQCVRLTDRRRQSLKCRLHEIGGLSKWTEAIELMPSIPFLLGCGPRGWVASIDFLLRQDAIPRILEGLYSRRTDATIDGNVIRHEHSHTSSRPSKADEVEDMVRRYRDRKYASEQRGPDFQSTDRKPYGVPGLQADHERHRNDAPAFRTTPAKIRH